MQGYNDLLAQADPSKNQSYYVWITRLYLQRNFPAEDIPSQVKDALVKYHTMKIRNQLPDSRYKDINFFKSLSQLVEILPDSDTVVVNDKGKYKVLVDDNTCLIVQLLDAQSGVYFGQGTNPTWCTAYPLDDPRNRWDTYKDDGPIYVIIPKVDKSHPNEKYQWQFNSQLTNRKNEWIEVSELRDLLIKCPVVKELFHDEVINNQHVFINYKVEFGKTLDEQKEIFVHFVQNNQLYDDYGRNNIAFWKLPEEIQNDKEIMLIAIKKNTRVYSDVPDHLVLDPDIVNYIASASGDVPRILASKKPNFDGNQQKLAEKYLNDKDLMMRCLYRDPYGYHCISEKLQKDSDIRNAVVCLVKRPGDLPQPINENMTLEEVILYLLCILGSFRDYFGYHGNFYDHPFVKGLLDNTLDIEDIDPYLKKAYDIIDKFGEDYSGLVHTKLKNLKQRWQEIAEQ
jgi:hypothetical protein